ncbi:MAG: cupin domain-containing protein [Pseudomonadota bacterium]
MSEPQPSFCLSKAEDAHFEPMAGFRDWLKTRDLGLSAATHCKYDAWVTRANDMGGSTGRHYHNYDVQVMFVIKGWVKMYYEGEGEMVLRAGDFVYHPPRHVHDFMDYSADIEIFELAAPAHHHAVDV